VAYKMHHLTFDEFIGTRYTRIKHIKGLQDKGRLDASLRWQGLPQQTSASA
jgi:hypothetical protein